MDRIWGSEFNGRKGRNITDEIIKGKFADRKKDQTDIRRKGKARNPHAHGTPGKPELPKNITVPKAFSKVLELIRPNCSTHGRI